MKSKMKVRKSAAKRYHVTGSDKIMRESAKRNHKNYHKSAAQKRRLDVSKEVSKSDKKRARRTLGI
jgi:large subunit ribosomal protein L35